MRHGFPMTVFGHFFALSQPTLFSKIVKDKWIEFPLQGLDSCVPEEVAFWSHQKKVGPWDAMVK